MHCPEQEVHCPKFILLSIKYEELASVPLHCLHITREKGHLHSILVLCPEENIYLSAVISRAERMQVFLYVYSFGLLEYEFHSSCTVVLDKHKTTYFSGFLYALV